MFGNGREHVGGRVCRVKGAWDVWVCVICALHNVQRQCGTIVLPCKAYSCSLQLYLAKSLRLRRLLVQISRWAEDWEGPKAHWDLNSALKEQRGPFG